MAAIRAAQLGGEVTLVEKHRLGGTCFNRGCIPTKSLLQSASLLWQAKNSHVFGVLVDNPRLDYDVVSNGSRKRSSVWRTGSGP